MTEESRQYDIIVFGAGIAGLWLANRLKRAGYNIILIEKDTIGGGQTRMLPGMLSSADAGLSERWQACLDGYGEIDLTGVTVLSETQTVFAADPALSGAAVLAAARRIHAKAVKLKKERFPEALSQGRKFRGTVCDVPEKVIDLQSLVKALAASLQGRIFKGEMTEVLPDGQAAISGRKFTAQALVFAAGAGNAQVFGLLNIRKRHTRETTARRIMLRSMDQPFYAQGLGENAEPRFTITAHADGKGGYVWVIGGAMADEGGDPEDSHPEIKDMFPDLDFPGIDWSGKEWSFLTAAGTAPCDAGGDLVPGPHLHQRGKILVAWPGDMMSAPLLSDRVFSWLKERDIQPRSKEAPPDLPAPDLAAPPWEYAVWRKSGP